MTATILAAQDVAPIYLQLGAAVFLLGLSARAAAHVGISPVPFYLLAGLVVGALDLPSLDGEVVRFAAQLGLILLLFLIGLEYTAEELTGHLRRFRRAGVTDALLNGPPGVILAVLLGWGWVAAVVLGGVTWASSSGITGKALRDLGRLVCPETPAIVSVLLVEELATAAYLPLVASLLLGGGVIAIAGSVAVAAGAVLVALIGALRYGATLGRLVEHRSEEAVLLSVLGLVLVVGGLAETLQVSAAVGAFLVGIALSGEVAERTRPLLEPIRDFNMALFFLFFGLQIDTGRLPSVAAPISALAVVTVVTKGITGWHAATLAGVDRPGRARAATALIAHGEIAIVLAGLAAGAGLEPQLAPLAAGYVLVTAIVGPVLMRSPDLVLRAVDSLLRVGLPRPGTSREGMT
ncbi:MAG TPA: cation:proton antiporter [Baekduia sp.]|uniref:cation:proton antiporter n=1 Tax=Baekduia sp. TaxID=2600305 RepID=UPI002CDE1887|nr:cation:proton antiporter [Baekduia sp.]HMJ35867.1 cation:proton antiporter [Baekduia sp.]